MTHDTRRILVAYAVYTNIYYTFDTINILFWSYAPCRLLAYRFISFIYAILALYLRVNGDVGPARSACRAKETEPESDFDKTWTPVIRYKLDCVCTVVTKQFSWENVVDVLSIERCNFCYRNFEILYFFLQFCTIITAGYDITKTWNLSSQWN